MRVIAPVVLLASICGLQLWAQTTGSVEGAVVDRVTGSGILDASVTFYARTQQGAIYEAKTDAAGEFRIFGMKPGSYEVRFEKDGYRFGSKIPPQPYILGESSSPVGVRLEMTRLVTLRGRVVDPDGNPMSKGEVRLANRNTVPVAPDGTFAIQNLEPGSYTLAAIPNAIRVPEGTRVPVLTYSPEPVVIRGDADISGYEIRLQTAEVYRLSGVVLDEAGNPKPKVAIQLLPKIQSGPRAVLQGSFMTFIGLGQAVGQEEARVTSAADGSFEFPQVRSGEWQLAGVSSGPIDAVDAVKNFHSGGLGVVIADRSIDNLQLRQSPSFQISSTIDWGDVPRGVRTSVLLQSADGRIVLPAPLFTQADGTMAPSTITPGRYLILPQPGAGYYPISVQLNGQEVIGKPADLIPGSAIRVFYKAASGSLHGTVDNCSGAVLLIPKEIQTLAFGRVAECKADGSFDAPGIPPGNYSAAAFRLPINLADLRDPAFLAKVISAGTSVSVGQSAATVQLKVIPFLE
jgi:hypothetical protein